MEKINVSLGLELKREFETTIVTEYIEGPSILQIGTTPNVSVDLSRAKYHVTVCSSNVQDMNNISTVTRKEQLHINFKEYDINLSQIEDGLYNTVVCLQDYSYDERHTVPSVETLLRAVKIGGLLIYNQCYLDNKVIPLGFEPINKWDYNALGHIDDQENEQDATILRTFFDAEEAHHFWTWLQLQSYVNSSNAHSTLYMGRKIIHEKSDHTSERNITSITKEESEENRRLGTVPVCC